MLLFVSLDVNLKGTQSMEKGLIVDKNGDVLSVGVLSVFSVISVLTVVSNVG